MMYHLVRPIAALAIRLFFRRIYLLNPDRLPKDGPVILAVNHPTAFIEPCILACLLPRTLSFLVRGNLYKKAWASTLLRSLNMLPIYRAKDGSFSDRKRNLSIFSACYAALGDGRVIMILPEGRTILEKRLRPLQKGTTRLAFGAIDEHPDLPLKMVPVSVTFTAGYKPRSEVMLKLGEPMNVVPYYKKYTDDPNAATRELLDDLKVNLKKNMVLIPRKEDELLSETVLTIWRNNQNFSTFPIIRRAEKRLLNEQVITTHVYDQSASARVQGVNLADQYLEKLRQLRLSDEAIARSVTGLHGLLLILGLPLFLVTALINAPLLSIGQLVIKTQVETLEFKMPVLIAVHIGTYFVMQIIVMVILNGTAWWAMAFSLIPTLYYFIRYQEVGLHAWRRYKFLKMTESKRQDLLNLRHQISKFIPLSSLS